MSNSPGHRLKIVNRNGHPFLRVLVEARRVPWNESEFNTKHMFFPLTEETQQRLDDELFEVVSSRSTTTRSTT